ncbi:MAG TPA: hypothetical protein VGN77_03645, partial [Steroidobacteraceae bacterium]|nr:hypothetical protein [Steroidobacteraceae bacterium]
AIATTVAGLDADPARALPLSKALFELSYRVTAIRPPTVPAGSARRRLTLSVARSETDLDELLAALQRVWRAEPAR